MVDPVKIFLTFSLITMQNLVVVSHTVFAHKSGSTNYGNACPHPVGWGRGWPVRNTLLPDTCYRMKLDRSTSNSMGANMGHKKSGDAGSRSLRMRAWQTLWNHASPLLVLPHKFGHSRSNHISIFNGKIWPFKVTGTDTDRSETYDFLLMIHSNHELSGTVSEINGNFVENRNFPTTRVCNAPTEEVPLEFCNGGRRQRTSHVPIKECNEFDDMCIQYNTSVWQTDGQICHNSIALCVFRHMLTRDKNYQQIAELS